MKLKFKRIGKCFYDAGYWTVHHDGIEHAGYLAFLAMLALFSFLIFFTALAGLLGQGDAGAQFINDLIAILPEHVASALHPRIDEILNGPPQGLLTAAIIGVIWTASSPVEGIRTILNRAYRVQTPPAYIWRRLLSIGQFFVLTLGVFMAMMMLVFVPVIWDNLWAQEWFITIFPMHKEDWQPVWGYARYGLSAGMLLLVVAISYYVLPNIKQKFIAVLPGTLIVLLGWLVMVDLFTGWLQNFDQVNLIYGSLGGIIATLIFFYLAGVIYIFGAELNYFLESSLGHDIIQKEDVPEELLVDSSQSSTADIRKQS